MPRRNGTLPEVSPESLVAMPPVNKPAYARRPLKASKTMAELHQALVDMGGCPHAPPRRMPRQEIQQVSHQWQAQGKIPPPPPPPMKVGECGAVDTPLVMLEQPMPPAIVFAAGTCLGTLIGMAVILFRIHGAL